MYVRPKKGLGQHFLKDDKIAERIVSSLDIEERKERSKDRVKVLEIGPGMGVLTKFLKEDTRITLSLVEIDSESVEYLKATMPTIGNAIIEGDFLRLDLSALFADKFHVIGNFPYNISSQIFFKILDYKESVPQVVCMIQREVAERLASAPGRKSYGILSVLLQAWYDIEYLFTVDEGSFIPPPKVKSAVIRLKRNSRQSLGCDEILFKNVVKTTFNQRRKTIRNSLKPLLAGRVLSDHLLLNMRPEQLSVEQFVELTQIVSAQTGSTQKD
jgi:dimethyladenosine transferase